MNTVSLIERKTIPMLFSRDFESLLIKSPIPHASLTHDLELAANKGLVHFQELESVLELRHTKEMSDLIQLTNKCLVMHEHALSRWYISISQDLLDEIEQIILIHGEDLSDIGLQEVTVATVLVMLSLTGVVYKDF